MRSDTPGDAGPQRAHAAHDEVDGDAGLARRVERLDDRRSTTALILITMRGRPTGGRVRSISRSRRSRKPGAQAVRRDEQAPERALAGHAGQDVEQVGDVRADLGSDGEQAEVDVEARRLGVVVAGADVDVAAQAAALAADDERASWSAS